MSGISGVLRSTPRDNPRGTMWIATLTTRDEQKKRAFSVATYGEEGARERAIAQRQEWLTQLPPHYHSMSDTSRAALAGHPVPAVAPSPAPMPLMTPEEINARVAVINADFDARMPRRLRWRVRARTAARPNGPLVVALSDAGFKCWAHAVQKSWQHYAGAKCNAQRPMATKFGHRAISPVQRKSAMTGGNAAWPMVGE